MDNNTIRDIRNHLAEAVQLLDSVQIAQERTNMKRYIVGVDRVEAALQMLDHMSKEEAHHEDDHDQQE